MSRLIMALAIVGLFIFLPLGGNNCAFAQLCKSQTSIGLGEGWYGPYTSCNKIVKNTFHFYISWQFQATWGAKPTHDENGTIRDREFWAADYEGGWHTVIWWYEDLTTTQNHRILLDFTPSLDPGRSFSSATYTVNYYASKPQ
jgi:hypothetical protein